MLIPVGYAQVNIKYTGAAVPLGAQITFGVQNTGSLTADQVADLVGDTYVGANMDQNHVGACAVSSILVKLGPNDTGASSELAYAIAGTLSGAAYSPNVGLLVQKITGLGGRKGRGRFFVPGQSESYISDGGLIDPAIVAADQANCTNFLADLSTAGVPMVLLHSTASPVPTPVTTLNVSPTVATQRRRLRR